jgi:hypothetical protein
MRPANVYAVSDAGILFAAGIGDERAYALQPARSIRPIELDQWRDGSAATWAMRAVTSPGASSTARGRARRGGLPSSYAETALPVVSVQLERTGVASRKAGL